MVPLINKVWGKEKSWERQVTPLYNQCAGSGITAANTLLTPPLCALSLPRRFLDIMSISRAVALSSEQDVALQHISSLICWDKATSCKTGGGRQHGTTAKDEAMLLPHLSSFPAVYGEFQLPNAVPLCYGQLLNKKPAEGAVTGKANMALWFLEWVEFKADSLSAPKKLQ